MGLFEGLGMLWIYTLLDMQCSPYMMILISRQQQSKMQNKKRGEHTWSWAYWHTISRPVLLLLSSDIWSFFLYKCCDHKLFTPCVCFTDRVSSLLQMDGLWEGRRISQDCVTPFEATPMNESASGSTLFRHGTSSVWTDESRDVNHFKDIAQMKRKMLHW